MTPMNQSHVRVGIGGAVAALLMTASIAHASVEISTAATSNMTCSGGVCTPTAKKAVLNVNDLTSMLASGDVKVTTGAGAITITVESPFSWTSTSRLTLDAFQNVSFKAPVTVAGTGAVTITYNDGGTDGDLIFFPGGKLDFWDIVSSLIIEGNNYTLIKDIKSLSRAIRENPNGFIALAKDYNATKDGTFNQSPAGKKLQGIVEGLGHAITHLSIVAPKHEVGLFGENGGTVRDIRLEQVSIMGQRFGAMIGALAAANYGTIIGAHITGTVTGGSYAFIGGLVGQNGGHIARSNSAALVSGGLTVGGLVGQNYHGSIFQSYSAGTVNGGYYIGGLVGDDDSYGNTDESYSTAAVASNSTTEDIGGITGVFSHGGASTMTESYAVGAIGPPRGNTGGVLGEDFGTPSNISSAYWDLDTSGISDPSQGAGNIPNDPGITGLTDAQLKSGLPTGFDPGIWGQSATINNGYPYLLANPPPQ